MENERLPLSWDKRLFLANLNKSRKIANGYIHHANNLVDRISFLKKEAEDVLESLEVTLKVLDFENKRFFSKDEKDPGLYEQFEKFKSDPELRKSMDDFYINREGIRQMSKDMLQNIRKKGNE